MAPGVKVFGSPTSAEVARVLACLFEKDVDFELIRVDAYKGQNKKPNYLKMQMSCYALTFEDEKLTMVDSRQICRHIIEKYANKGNQDLLGSGTMERASIEQWLLTEQQMFDPPSSALVFNLAFIPAFAPAFAPQVILEEDKVLVEENKKKLKEVLDMYEQRLEVTPYLAGNKFTLADLSHLPNTESLMKIDECKEMFEKKDRVMAWWKRISTRKQWMKVVEMQKETLPIQKKMIPPPPPPPPPRV